MGADRMVRVLGPKGCASSLLVTFMLCCLAVSAVFAADAKTVDQLVNVRLAAVAGRIEVVSVNQQLSHLEYYQQIREQADVPLTFPHLTIPLPTPRTYGSLESLGNGRFRRGHGNAGLLFELAPAAGGQNLLPYQAVTLTGNMHGIWQVAMADERLAVLQDNLPLGRLALQGGRQTFSLDNLPATFDLGRVKYLVLRLEGASGTLALSGLAASRNRQGNGTAERAAWLWSSRQVPGNEQVVLERLQRHAIKRLYLQIDDDLQRFEPFLRRARAQGVTVYALDGAPDSHLQSAAILKRIESVTAFNRTCPQAAFSGFQLDVEPYLLQDFALDRQRHVAAYLALLDAARSRVGSSLSLSVALPFWFSRVPTRHKDLAQEVLNRADEVVVMAYRRNYEEVLQLSTPILAAGERAGKPVWLGVELTSLPDEEHQVLVPAGPDEHPALVLAGRRWKVSHTYQVRGSALSFAGAPALLVPFLQKKPAFSSFKGWAVHSLDVMDGFQ